MRRRWMATLAATAALAGCGGDETTTADGPAALVPATGAALYGEAIVRPEGGRADGIEAALRKVARRDDVLALLRTELDKALAEGPELTYAQDIEPWLGERAGIFFLGFEGEPDGAVILEVTDEDAAREALEKARPNLEIDDAAAELLDGHMVLGSRAGVDAARRAADGDSLADAESYTETLDVLDEERLGHVWVDVKRALEATPADAGLGAVRERLAGTENAMVLVGADVAADRLAIEFAASKGLLEAAGSVPATDRAASLLADLPAESWFALAFAGGGQNVAEGFRQGLGPSGSDVLGQIERMSGVDIEADLLTQLEDAAVSVSGTGITSLGAGLLFATKDGGRVLDAVRKLAESFGRGQISVEPAADGFVARLLGAPFAIQVKRDGDRIAAALGADAAGKLLEPSERLEDAETYDRAVEDLGDGAELVALLEFEPMLALVSSLAGGDPGFQEARPFLEAYERLAIGQREDGETVVGEVVVQLK